MLSIEDSSVEEENGSDGCRFEELTPVQSPEFPPVVSYTLLTEEDQSPETDSNLVQAGNCGKEVWTLIQFFLFPFFKKSLICLEGKSMTPCQGITILFRSSQQLLRLRLVRCFRNYRGTMKPSGVPR